MFAYHPILACKAHAYCAYKRDGENPFGLFAIGPALAVGVQPFGTVLHHDAWRNAPAHVTPSAGPLAVIKKIPT